MPAVSFTDEDGTIGGAIGAGAAGTLSSLYGTLGRSVQRVEVVLSNGDVVQTERISKREVARKKGLTTLEGDIYRQLDNLIDDNAELIDRLRTDGGGYDGISRNYRGEGKGWVDGFDAIVCWCAGVARCGE